MKTYSELIKLPTFEERFEYLKLEGQVGETTFGYDRWINQIFYKSVEWRALRKEIILRDCGYDLGMEGRTLIGHIIVHHMNPISVKDVQNRTDLLLNPEYLISTSHLTHTAIHYGDESLLIPSEVVERKPNDTCPWLQNR